MKFLALLVRRSVVFLREVHSSEVKQKLLGAVLLKVTWTREYLLLCILFIITLRGLNIFKVLHNMMRRWGMASKINAAPVVKVACHLFLITLLQSAVM